MDQDQAQEPEYVGFWIRFAAFLINNVLILLVGAIALLVYGPELIDQPLGSLFLNLAIELANSKTLAPLTALVFVAFWIFSSAEPGKMVFSAVIVRASDHGKPRNWQLIVRYLGYYVSLLPFGLGFFWIGWDRRKQGWHDKMAGTVVIRK